MKKKPTPNPNDPKLWLRMARGFDGATFLHGEDGKYTSGICWALTNEGVEYRPEAMLALKPSGAPEDGMWFHGRNQQHKRAALCRKIAAVLKADNDSAPAQ